MNAHLRVGESAFGLIPEDPGAAVVAAREARWKNRKTTASEVTDVNQIRKDAPVHTTGASASISEREGIRTPGLQLRRLPPYPD